jgi:hypothetical protein
MRSALGSMRSGEMEPDRLKHRPIDPLQAALERSKLKRQLDIECEQQARDEPEHTKPSQLPSGGLAQNLEDRFHAAQDTTGGGRIPYGSRTKADVRKITTNGAVSTAPLRTLHQLRCVPASQACARARIWLTG